MGRSGRGIDAGWPLLVAGLALVAAVVLVPAHESLRQTRFERDKLLAMDAQGRERVRRLARYLAALERGEPGLVRSLAFDQMRLIPEGRTPLLPPAPLGPVDVFDALDPPPVTVPAVQPIDSMLGRWALDRGLRPWLLAAGAMMAFVGVLPQSRPRAGR
ncbi:MAG: hypothetical protein AAFX79_01350 [Planctomycetota bacterium]